MDQHIRFVLFQGIIVIPFIAGSFLKGRISRPDVKARSLLNINIRLLDPVIILWSMWGLSFLPALLLLPVAGLVLVLCGFAAGKVFGHALVEDNRRRSIFTISASLANHGFTLGGFICYMFMGEKGLGLSALFLLYFTPYTFLFIFPYARRASAEGSGRMPGLKENLLTIQNMPLFAALTALILHASGVHRPAIDFPLDLLLMVSIGMYYLTLGMNFSPGRVFAFKQEHMYLAIIKFILLPVATLLLLNIIPLSSDMKIVILLESFMPAAIYSVVSAVLFDLDPEAASGMFVINTLIFLIIVLPLLLILLPSLV